MKEQTLVEYLIENKFETVIIGSTVEHENVRAKVAEIVKETLGVKATEAVMTLERKKTDVFEPTYKMVSVDGRSMRKEIFIAGLTIGITDGDVQVYRVGHKHGTVVGQRFKI